ncbi:MAG: aminodeoxychorismate synthase component I, partial [Legionellales bacterium]
PYDRVTLTESTTDLKKALETLSQSLCTEISDLDLPFQGGAIGYIAYDLGTRLLGLESPRQTSLEDMPLLDLGFYDWALIADHQLKKLCIFSANRCSKTPDIISEVISLLQTEVPKPPPFILKGTFEPLLSKNSYKDAFESIQECLQAGRSYQVNYTQAFQAAYEGNSWSMYTAIAKQNPLPFSAYIKTHDAEIISFSPERFLLYDKGCLLTAPIKGTIGRSSDPELDAALQLELSQSLKNRAENVMIVDLMRNDLGKIAQAGSVQVLNLCAIQSFNSVHHLVSEIQAQCLDTIRPFDAFISCFPGGSITGAPKLEAMRIIQELEPYARGVYCGSIGYFSNHGRFDTNIAIRTLTAKNTMLHLASGGGIVIDSNCEDEYSECYTKITAILKGIGALP